MITQPVPVQYSEAVIQQIGLLLHYSSIYSQKEIDSVLGTVLKSAGETYDEGTMWRNALYMLLHAETVFWQPELCDLVYESAKTLQLATLSKSDLLILNGFSWFEKPIPMPSHPNREGHYGDLIAISWGCKPTGQHIDIMFFVKEKGVPVLDSVGAWVFGNLSPVNNFQIDEGLVGSQRAIMLYRYLHTSILLLQQRILRSYNAPPNRLARKMLTETLKSPDRQVRIVTFRQPERAPNHQDEHDIIDWQYRWFVSGHWRQQACGHNREERRPVWITPYLKGPESKPIKPQAERLFAVVR